MYKRQERNSVYNSFRPYEWNLYRSSFNKAICDNAFGSAPDGIYTSVYYFEGTNSDYVMSRPINADGATIGYLNLYLKGDGWAQCLSDSGYEGVITDNEMCIRDSPQGHAGYLPCPLHRGPGIPGPPVRCLLYTSRCV